MTIRVTIRAEGLDHVNGTVAAITSQQNAVDRSLIVGAPEAAPAVAQLDDAWLCDEPTTLRLLGMSMALVA